MSNWFPFSNSLALGARLRPRGVKVRAVRECVTFIRVYRSVHRGVADEVSVVINVCDGGLRRLLSLLRTPAHSVRCGLLTVFSAVVMDPVVLNPVMPSTAPGAVFVCSPWNNAHPDMDRDRALHVCINTRLLRDDASALIVEPPHAARLSVSQVVFRRPSYDTLLMWQRPSSSHALPVVYVFVHERVVDTPLSPWLHALTGYRATVLRRLPSGVIHYTATYTPALCRPGRHGADSRPSPGGAAGSAGDGVSAGEMQDGSRRSARLAGRPAQA